MKEFDLDTAKETDITPQSLESNDGRFRIEIEMEDYFKLTYYHYDVNDVNFNNPENRSEITFDSKDRDRLIEILLASKMINPHPWKDILTIREEKKKGRWE
jgi:hypothetical protein